MAHSKKVTVARRVGTIVSPKRKKKQCLRKILEGQAKSITVFLILANWGMSVGEWTKIDLTNGANVAHSTGSIETIKQMVVKAYIIDATDEISSCIPAHARQDRRMQSTDKCSCEVQNKQCVFLIKTFWKKYETERYYFAIKESSDQGFASRTQPQTTSGGIEVGSKQFVTLLRQKDIFKIIRIASSLSLVNSWV